ncbi:Gp138 family membrane-puncturing spike protein [Indiicoccus explosivorum]|uniref:Gp138 family membrane-puncturing spike protein n=1 Tax=Indiicoccus explosivorum TaxID=1917864 RepID=UPI000B44B935|nr:Gp138 family membrane-puncturing spike protein [Indiicoccus explosivorum]
MSEDMSFFRKFKQDILLSINTSMPAKVISYDKAQREAKVQPLYKSKEKGREPVTLPVLESVPVLFQRFEVDGVEREYLPVIRAGDIVLLSFSQRELDDALTGQPAYPSPNRLFPLTGAVIVGVIT